MSNCKIAVTGGIGSGKTTACEILESFGYTVFDCDKIVAQAQTEKETLEKISEQFPTVVQKKYDKENSQLVLDKKALSQIVFADKQKLRILENIMHPIVMKKLLEDMNNCTDQICFAEVPLLFEGKYEKLFDEIIVVKRELTERVQSVIIRSSITKEEVLKRIKNQYDYENLPKNAHTVYNDGEIDKMSRTLKEFTRGWEKLYSHM